MMRRMMNLQAIVMVLVVTSLSPGWAQTTSSWNAQLYATREQLEELLTRYNEASQSNAYSAGLRDRARYEGSLIRQRIEQGDFQVGDRVALFVDGEPTLSDTLVVSSEIDVVLGSGDTVSLKQVLRSEVQAKLRAAIARVVREPRVRTETFLRIGILGAVGSQGFKEVRADALLSDVLMQVGGVSNAADLTGMSVERDKRKIWEGDLLQEALVQGRTVDQLSLRAGDIINVPATRPGKSIFATLRTVMLLAGPLYALQRLTGLF